MPDITMCKGTGCDMRDACYRFRAVPSKRQSFMAFRQEFPLVPCADFVRIEKGDRLRELPEVTS